MSAVEDAAKVLAEHRWTVRAEGATCGCGEKFGWLTQRAVEGHRHHVAEALAAAGLLPEGETRTEWGVRYPDGMEYGYGFGESGERRARYRRARYLLDIYGPGAVVLARSVTTGEWREVES